MVYVHPGIRLGEYDAQTFLGIWDTNGSTNLGQTTRPSDSQQKKKKKKERKEKLSNSELCRPGKPLKKN